MAIYSPQPQLTATERELLRLLAELIIDTGFKSRTNLPADHAVLSDKEAALLIELLEDFSSSKKFVESAFFVEEITRGDDKSNQDLREIYLSWRQRYGRTRAMASTHWFNFLTRLGRVGLKFGYVRGLDGSPREMSYSHFREMERLLLNQPGIDGRIKSIILSVVDTYQSEVESARHGDSPLPKGSISKLPASIITSLRDQTKTSIASNQVPSAQVAGLMTILADTSVLFSTRDWGVAGTMSTIAGGFASASYR